MTHGVPPLAKALTRLFQLFFVCTQRQKCNNLTVPMFGIHSRIQTIFDDAVQFIARSSIVAAIIQLKC